MTGPGKPAVRSWIVTCGAVAELAAALREVPEARLLRALGPGRAVVVAPASARERLAALPGVQHVRPDERHELHQRDGA